VAVKGISPEEQAWLVQIMTHKATQLVITSDKAAKSVSDLAKALGGNAPQGNIKGWLESVPEVVDKTAIEVVAKAEKLEADGSVGKAETVAEKVSEEVPDEIPDEIYDELAKALAEDLAPVIEEADQMMFAYLAKDEDGLWAGVRKMIIEELSEQQLLGAGKAGQEAIAEALRESAWQALMDAFDGLCAGLDEAGGYAWLLAQEEA
jgi:hypothetical protein